MVINPVTRRSLLGAAIGSLPFLNGRLQAASSLSVGMVPDAGATQVSLEEKAPLREYLAKSLGVQVKLIVPTNYNATVEGLGNNSLDFAYLGALTYVKAHARYGVLPLVQREADKKFHSVFVTQGESPIHKLTDVKGKKFAFGDINSTSGHLIPYRDLKKAGLNVETDLTTRYTGSHAATLKAVESGAADAGALDETVYKAMTTDGKVDPKKVRIFSTSEPFVDYVWVGRKDLDRKTLDSFANAFLALKEGKDDGILNILRGKNFQKADDSEYGEIRTIATELKML